MSYRVRQANTWSRVFVAYSLRGLLGLGGLLTIGWLGAQHAVLRASAQTAAKPAQEAPHAHHDHHAHHNHPELAPFMIRNAYHFSTLYHAARAARWELAAYQIEEMEKNLTKAMAEAGPFAPFLKDFLKDYVEPLEQTVAAKNVEQFRTAFQATVDGCNDCHKATKHAFIVIPAEPPSLSIFALPPVGK